MSEQIIIQPQNTNCTLVSTHPTSTYVQFQVGERNDNTDRFRTLIGFNKLSDGTVPKYSKIISAVLSLYLTGNTADNARTMRVFRQKRAWVETQATETVYSTGNNWQSLGGFGVNDCEQTDIGSISIAAAEAIGWKNITLTTVAIQEMVSGIFPNNGFMLKMDTESNDAHTFGDKNAGANAAKITIQLENGKFFELF